MSCGLPVISSIIGGTPDMITHGRDGLLVQQRDESGLSRAIEELTRDIEARQRLGDAARQRTLRYFDYRRTSRLLLDAIEQHCRHGASTPALPASAPPDKHPALRSAPKDDAKLVIS